MSEQTANVGDYVLATKYEDGDPCDHFFVGFISGFTHHGRILVVDGDGQNQRGNGFRRAEKITADEGRQIVALIPTIGDKPGPSLWWHLANIRGEIKPNELNDAPLPDLVTIDVRGCARCCGNHDEMAFQKLHRPTAEEPAYTHWAMCPETGEPVLMRGW